MVCCLKWYAVKSFNLKTSLTSDAYPSQVCHDLYAAHSHASSGHDREEEEFPLHYSQQNGEDVALKVFFTFFTQHSLVAGHFLQKAALGTSNTNVKQNSALYFQVVIVRLFEIEALCYVTN